MPNQAVTYTFTIRNASTVANPDGTANALVITSIPGGANPYLAGPPSGDGQEVDPLTGAIRTGAYTVEVVDAKTGTDATGTIRAVTNVLEDATFRQQLISRRAYIDITRAGSTTRLLSGYVLGIRLVSPMRYAFTIGDTRRVEQSQTIFQGPALGSFTTRGTLTGGPITADWGPVKSRGGWRYRMINVSGNDWYAEFVDGYAPGRDAPIVTDWRKLKDQRISETIEKYWTFNPYAWSLFSPATSTFVTSYSTVDQTTGNVVGGIATYAGATPGAVALQSKAMLVGYSQTPATEFLGIERLYFYWPSCPFSNNQVIYLSLSTYDVTEDTPLYIDAHPVDIVTAIWSNARIAYNPSGAWIASVKALVGDNVRLALRLTEAPKISEFLDKAIFGPFGIAARTNSAGEQELFPTRIRTDAIPSLTISTADLRSMEEAVFDLDEATAVSAVTLTQVQMREASFNVGQTVTVEGQTVTIPRDSIVATPVSQTAQYLDPNLTVFTGRAIEYNVPGMIHTAEAWDVSQSNTLIAIAGGMFDRFGRGAQAADVAILATSSGAAAQVGDEVYFDVAHFPNRGYRIGESTVGARIMQVVRRTETPSGPVLRLLDSGLAAQPVTPAPTITIAANPSQPNVMARFTITNAATINATGVLSVRVEWATGASTPTSGADFALYQPGQVPTTAVDLPGMTTPGARVWVRARTEQLGRRPSAWTAWTSVLLSNLPVITGVTTSNLRQTAVTVSWTNGSGQYPIIVYAYQGGSAPANWSPYEVAVLPPNSTSTTVRNLTGPGVQWTIGLAYRNTDAIGPVATVTVTTNSTLDTPLRPAGLAVIPGVDDVTLVQGVALAMWPADQTLDLIIERSATSGSGFTQIARVAGSTPVYIDERPRDGATWYYRIAHALGGYAVSTYTPEVSAIARGVPRDAVRPSAVTPVVQVETTEVAGTGTVTLTITDSQSRVTQVRFRERTNGGAWSAWTVDSSVPYSYGATIPTTGFVEIQYEVTGYNAAGEVGLLAGGIESFDANQTADMISVVGTFTNAGAFVLAISADSDTGSIKFATSTTSQPTLATVQGQTAINSRNYSTTLTGPYAANATVFVSVLGYTGTGGTGTESALFEYRFTRDGGLVYTMCSASMSAATATTISVTVTGTAPSGTPTVQLVAITGSASLSSGPAIGVASASGTTWVFNRGAALGGSGQAKFRSVLAGAQSDDDFIEIPEQGRDTVYLASRARVTSTSQTTVVVRYAVADPYPQGANSVTVSYSTTGLGTVSPSSGGTITPAATLTEAANTYIDYTVPRPAPGTGPGRITFTASASNRVTDSDAVDIPPQTSGAVACTGAFTDAGAFLLTITAGAETNSIKYATSTSSQPTLATVQGQTATNARTINTTLSGPYALGATLYISVLTYSGTSGTGQESTLYEFRFQRFNVTGQYSYRQSASIISRPSSNSVYYTTAATGEYSMGDALGSLPNFTTHFANVLVPRGVILRSVTLRAWSNYSGDYITMSLFRNDGTGAQTQLGSDQTLTGTGTSFVYSNLTVGSLSENTTDRSYIIRVFNYIQNITSSNGLLSVTYTYDKSDLTQNI